MTLAVPVTSTTTDSSVVVPPSASLASNSAWLTDLSTMQGVEACPGASTEMVLQLFSGPCNTMLFTRTVPVLFTLTVHTMLPAAGDRAKHREVHTHRVGGGRVSEAREQHTKEPVSMLVYEQAICYSIPMAAETSRPPLQAAAHSSCWQLQLQRFTYIQQHLHSYLRAAGGRVQLPCWYVSSGVYVGVTSAA